MNKAQKILIAVFFALTVLSYFLTTSFGIDDSVLLFKFGLRLTMLSAAVVLLKKMREHLFITLAFIFSVVSDYYFVLAKTFEAEPANRQLFGIVGFIMAYPALIMAFSRGIKFRRIDPAAAAPFVLTFAVVLWFLLPHATGVLFIPSIVLGVILCIYGWTSIAALYRGIYSPWSARFIAMAGVLIFISDMVVAFDLFYPVSDWFLKWKEWFIWITYVPGWTLYLAVMADDRLLLKEGAESGALKERAIPVTRGFFTRAGQR